MLEKLAWERLQRSGDFAKRCLYGKPYKSTALSTLLW